MRPRIRLIALTEAKSNLRDSFEFCIVVAAEKAIQFLATLTFQKTIKRIYPVTRILMSLWSFSICLVTSAVDTLDFNARCPFLAISVLGTCFPSTKFLYSTLLWQRGVEASASPLFPLSIPFQVFSQGCPQVFLLPEGVRSISEERFMLW